MKNTRINQICYFSGRSNTSVNDYIAQPTIENITSFINTNETLSNEDWSSNNTTMAMDDIVTIYDTEALQNNTSVT